MCGSIICLAAVLLGVDASWPTLPDGGRQYVIQIEPQVLDRLESGDIEAVGSYVPPHIKDIRAFRITIGPQKLPNNAHTASVQSPILTGVDTDWVSLPAGRVECRLWIKPETIDELQKSGRVIEGKIPADARSPSLFTIAVGTKPSAESLPATNAVEPVPIVSEPVEPEADSLPVDPATSPPITQPDLAEPAKSWPPLPIIEPPSLTPFATTAPTLTNVEPALTNVEPALTNVEPALPPSEAGAGSRPMPEQQANHVEPMKTTPLERPKAKVDSNSTTEKESTAGGPATLPLSPTVTFLGLIASLAVNLFLLWIMRDFRSRYRELLGRMGEVGDIVKSCVLELERSG